MQRILSILVAICLINILTSCSKTEEANQIGAVKVIAGGNEYIPLQNWIFSLSKDGVAADGARKYPQEVEGELPVVPYHDDLQILIDGEITGDPSYTLYGSDDKEVYYGQPVFTLPDKPGNYTVSVEVVWGNDKEYEGYQYLFAISWPEPVSESDAPAGKVTVTFPASDEGKTEFNASVYEIDPFDLSLELPDGWKLKEWEQNQGYDFIAVFSKLLIYNENDECVGVVGYNTYELYEGAEDDPRAIYNQIALGNNYHFDIRESYAVVNETNTGTTAITDVYYSLGNGEEKYNKGIVSYNKDLLVYIAMEFDNSKILNEQLNNIAKSIQIFNEPQESLDFEQADSSAASSIITESSGKNEITSDAGKQGIYLITDNVPEAAFEHAQHMLSTFSLSELRYMGFTNEEAAIVRLSKGIKIGGDDEYGDEAYYFFVLCGERVTALVISAILEDGSYGFQLGKDPLADALNDVLTTAQNPAKIACTQNGFYSVDTINGVLLLQEFIGFGSQGTRGIETDKAYFMENLNALTSQGSVVLIG